ncbi:nucleoprotein TPR-like [Mobula birostris]|uniref:nucleoprotein TPR-like n=1 Tax=Mobula birostris TaxID=1983395 RepID=UPI003B281653
MDECGSGQRSQDGGYRNSTVRRLLEVRRSFVDGSGRSAMDGRMAGATSAAEKRKAGETSASIRGAGVKETDFAGYDDVTVGHAAGWQKLRDSFSEKGSEVPLSLLKPQPLFADDLLITEHEASNSELVEGGILKSERIARVLQYKVAVMGGWWNWIKQAEHSHKPPGHDRTAPRQQQAVVERPASRARHSPRRPPHPLPPRLTIQPPAPELGPPAQRFPPARQPSSSRGGIQLTPGIGGVQQHFVDEDDRMVPSTPTLVVPHRSDGFAEAIPSPQVAGVPRFRFGPPEDMNQTSSSQSDLGQLASQGGLGMYETPIYLAAVHKDEPGGHSVPTTPLQVHAPVTVLGEGPQTDITEHASQSVPMVATSMSNLSSTVESGGGDDGDEVFIEGADQEELNSDVMLEIEGHPEEESAQPSDEADIPSTSQDPPSSSADAAITQLKLLRRVRLYPQMGRIAA